VAAGRRVWMKLWRFRLMFIHVLEDDEEHMNVLDERGESIRERSKRESGWRERKEKKKWIKNLKKEYIDDCFFMSFWIFGLLGSDLCWIMLSAPLLFVLCFFFVLLYSTILFLLILFKSKEIIKIHKCPVSLAQFEPRSFHLSTLWLEIQATRLHDKKKDRRLVVARRRRFNSYRVSKLLCQCSN
jgi:hypothetical protein